MFIAGMPVVFLLLMVYVFGGTLGSGLGTVAGGREAYIAYVVPGILLVTIAGAATGTSISVAMDMTEGIVARFRTMSIARVAVLTGHVGGSLVQIAIALAIVMIAAVLIGFRPTTGPLAWVAAAGMLALAAIAVTWLAVALGMVTKSVETASNLPMILLLLRLPEQRVRADRVPAGTAGLVRRAPAVHADHRDGPRAAARHSDRDRRDGRGRVVRRDLGRQLPVGAQAVRAGPVPRGEPSPRWARPSR